MALNVPILKIKPAIRQEIVKRELCQGRTVSEIVNVLRGQGICINEKTVDRDIYDIRMQVQKELENQKEPLYNILANFVLVYNEAYRESWKLYNSTTDDRTKIRCLEIIAKMNESKVKIMQSLGIITENKIDSRLEIVWKPPYSYNENGS